MTDRQSFTDITEWMKLVENAPEMPFLLVGNKIDSPRCSMLLRAQHAACRLYIVCVASEAPAVAHSAGGCGKSQRPRQRHLPCCTIVRTSRRGVTSCAHSPVSPVVVRRSGGVGSVGAP